MLRVDRQGGAEGAKKEEENKEHTTKDDELSEGGVSDTVIGPGATSTTSVFLEGIGSKLVVDKTTKGDRVTEELKRSNGVAEDEHRGNDKKNILEDTAKRKNERGGSANLDSSLATICGHGRKKDTYQENDRDVETEGNHGVEQESEVTDAVEVSPGHGWDFSDQSDDSVHDGASGSKVVERDQGVHLELGRRKKALDHGQANGLENDTSTLEEETEHDELDLSERGDDDTNNDERDVSEGLQVGRRKTHNPRCDQDGDRGSCLELCQFPLVQKRRDKQFQAYLDHLDEGDRKVEVSEVTTDERQREEETDGNDSSKVDSAVHGDLLS